MLFPSQPVALQGQTANNFALHSRPYVVSSMDLQQRAVGGPAFTMSVCVCVWWWFTTINNSLSMFDQTNFSNPPSLLIQSPPHPPTHNIHRYLSFTQVVSFSTRNTELLPKGWRNCDILSVEKGSQQRGFFFPFSLSRLLSC